MQAALTTMVRIIERVGLQTNLGKTKAMLCTPGFICGKQGDEVYKRRATWGGTFWESNRTMVSCEVFGGTMATSSLQHHMERAHGRVLPQVSVADVGGGRLEVYKVLFT